MLTELITLQVKFLAAATTTAAAATMDVVQTGHGHDWEDLTVKGILVLALFATLAYLHKILETKDKESIAREARRDTLEAKHEATIAALRAEHRMDYEMRDARSNAVLAAYIEKMDELIKGINKQNQQHELLIKNLVTKYLKIETEEGSCPTPNTD